MVHDEHFLKAAGLLFEPAFCIQTNPIYFQSVSVTLDAHHAAPQPQNDTKRTHCRVISLFLETGHFEDKTMAEWRRWTAPFTSYNQRRAKPEQQRSCLDLLFFKTRRGWFKVVNKVHLPTKPMLRLKKNSIYRTTLCSRSTLLVSEHEMRWVAQQWEQMTLFYLFAMSETTNIVLLVLLLSICIPLLYSTTCQWLSYHLLIF